MSDNPNVGPDPVQAVPNHVREKTYREPSVPASYRAELTDLPEKTAEDAVREEMPEAIDAVKKKLADTPKSTA